MLTNLNTPEARSAAETYDLMLRVLLQVANSRMPSGTNSTEGILRIETPVPDGGCDTWRWLESIQLHPKLYFADRSGDAAVAAAGAACQLRGKPLHRQIEEAGRILRASSAGVAFHGGGRFDPEGRHSPAWEEFGVAELMVPRFELSRREGRRFLALHLAPGESPAGIDVPVFKEPDGAVPSPAVPSRTDEPAFEQWAEAVEELLKEFQTGRLAKVVPARETLLDLAESARPWRVLERLCATAEDCFHFGYQPSAGAAVFLGASPELLFQRRGALVCAEAVAGTRPRAAAGEEDGRLAGQLLSDPKEAAEHRFVSEMVGETLRGLFGSVRQDNRPKLMQLSGLQHLATRFQAVAENGISDSEVLQALHPTPAVGGTPKQAALEWMRRAERFDRGWYAGPFGRISSDETLFAVAIRSALLAGATARIYAGAGIVAGSDARREWEELERKAAGLLEIFGA